VCWHASKLSLLLQAHAAVAAVRCFYIPMQDEPDPLDAFMAGNAAAVAPPVKQEQQQQDVTMTDADAGDTGQVKSEPAPAAAEEEEEPDPLDAFMAAEVRCRQLGAFVLWILCAGGGSSAGNEVHVAILQSACLTHVATLCVL
jgi:hypothetical protein